MQSCRSLQSLSIYSACQGRSLRWWNCIVTLVYNNIDRVTYVTMTGHVTIEMNAM